MEITTDTGHTNRSKSRTNCCVPQCTAYHSKDKTVSFHSFPRQEDQKKHWIQILKLGKKPGAAARVCSKHFDALDIKDTGEFELKLSCLGTCPNGELLNLCLFLTVS